MTALTSVVFLHGLLGSPDEWNPLIQALESELPKRAWSLPLADDWQAGVQRLLDQLPNQYVLVGYSLGGRLALGAALAAPHRLRGLCLISSNPGLAPEERAARRRNDEQWARRMLQDAWPKFLEAWYRQPVFSSLDEATRAEWIRQKLTLDRPYHANLLRCYGIANQPDFWPTLSQIAVPTTVVVGQCDRKYVEIAEAMRRRAPRFELRIVPAAGHAVHRERPTALRAILQTLLDSLPSEHIRHE
jgi:2-succinyl-6-hydroxy-2,4-cyclohexadiene-1-carboxylate synthase